MILHKLMHKKIIIVFLVNIFVYIQQKYIMLPFILACERHQNTVFIYKKSAVPLSEDKETTVFLVYRLKSLFQL